MVAIFTGLGSGTERGSGSVLGGAGLLGSGTLGRSGEQVLLNAATGNLVIQQKDEMLVGRGPDAVIGRTYNSLGDLSDDNGDNWRQSTDRRIYGLVGTANSWGSSIRRISGDGSETVYEWNGSAYVATDGAGAYDRITYDGTWRWTDGDSGTVETYGIAYGGQLYLTQLTDTSGNVLTYDHAYGDWRVTGVTTANGEYIGYGWSGNNVVQITTYAGSTLTRTRYAYDSANRLTSVTVDLSPEDNSIADGKTYVTTYTYDGMSKRVATITETDGSQLAITYDGLGKVKTLTQTVASGVTRTTTIDYHWGYTNITDASGQVTRLDYADDDFAQQVENWETHNVSQEPATIDGAAATKYTVQNGDQGSWVIRQGLSFAAGDTISFGLTLQAVGSITSQILGLYSDQAGWGSANISSARIVSGPGTIEQVAGGLWRVVGLSTTQGTRIEITRTYDHSGSGGAYFYVDDGGLGAGAQLIAADATLLRSTTATSLSQMDLGTWSYVGYDRQPAGTIDGAQAYRYTVQQPGQWVGIHTNLSAKAGDTFTLSMSFTAVGDSTALGIGLVGYASDWGVASLASARIISGPGTIEQVDGGFFRVSGLSTTTPTRMEITRIYDRDEGIGAYFYVDEPNGFRAGASLIAAAPKLTRQLAPSAQGGQLLKITAPPAQPGGPQQITQFSYNASGDIASVIDASGNATSFTYDANGNVLTATDRLGNVVTRTYGSRNEVLTETRTGSDASGAAVQHTVRYAYDANGRLRFTVSAEGNVVEHRYDAYGQDWLNLTYTDQSYNVDGLAPSSTLAESDLAAWVAALGDQTAVQQVAFLYDARGNVSRRADYGESASPGNPAPGSGYTDTFYTYDQAGQLLARTVLSQNSEQFVYDGLGRVIASTDLDGGTTSIVFNDAAGQTVVALASGLVQVSTYNKAGELVAYTDSGAWVAGGTTTYKYDQLGRVRQKTDANGLDFYYVYDQAGRKIAEVNARGEMVEYRYDANDRVVATVRYLNAMDVQALLSDPNANVTASAIRPEARVGDLWTWTVYDKEGRVIEAIDGDGGVTGYEYDGSGRLVKTVDYAAKLDAGTLASLRTTPPGTPVLPGASAQDRISRSFYDKDGRLVGALDGEGYLSRIRYNAAGEKVEETAFANATDPAYRAGGSFAQLIASVGASAADRTMRYVFDKQGLLIFTIDALNHVTEFVYPSDVLWGATGMVRQTIRYAGAIAALSTYSIATVRSALSNAGLAGNADNRTSFAVYDAAERLAYAIDAAGGVIGYTYDDMGRVTRTRAFAITLATDALPSKASMDAWAANNPSSYDRITRNYYTERGELRFVVDAEGYVTRNDYDFEGRLVAVVKWSTAISVDDATTILGVHDATGGDYAATTYEYDAANRLLSTNDSYGNRHYYAYNANGTLAVDVVAFNGADESRTVFNYDGAGRVITRYDAAGTSEQAVTSFSYNAFGDVVATTDPRGNTTGYSYDKLGRRLSTTDRAGGVTRYEYDAFGNEVAFTDARGNSTYSYYNALGQLIVSRDAEDYITETSYTVFGDIASVTRRYNRAINGASATVWPAGTADPARDAVTLFGYDKLGRVTSTTDAEGHTERTFYNAFGGVSQIQNKLGLATSYIYDRRGLLSHVYIGPVYDANGNQTAAGYYRYIYEYDARGNRTHMVEAYGLPEQRDTYYVYDKLDRLIEKRGTLIQVGRYREQSYATPTERYSYDQRGNLTSLVDAGGGKTYYYYDDLDRQIAAIDATGVLSTKSYDPNGNVVASRTYATAIALPSVPGGYPPAPPSGDYRETSYTYDKLDRLKTTSIAGVRTGSWDGSAYTTAVTTITTSLDYDANGNVIKATDGNGGVVYAYYDRAGRKDGQIDQLGYRTDWDLDSEGNVRTEIRYAAAATGYSADSRGTVTPTAADRTTSFTYDRNGNRLAETRYGLVDVSSVDPSSGALAVDSRAVTSTIAYTYDALGQVLSKRQSTGDVFSYGYDTSGRLIREVRPGYDDAGTLRAPETTYRYDGLDNLVRAEEGSHVTLYSYGPGGRLASMTDASGAERSYYYDVAGRKIGEAWHRLDSAGADHFEGISYGYDVLGRLTYQSFAEIRSDDWADIGDRTGIAYDAFGEVTERSTNGIAQELFRYDRAGRVVASRTGDGVWRYHVYDAAGNRTLALESDGSAPGSNMGVDLKDKTLDEVLGLATGNGAWTVGSSAVAGVSATISVYDGRGQAVGTREPKRQLTAGSGAVDLVEARSYTAFGEVASESDAGGYTTRYAYNAMGRLVQVTRPEVSVTGEDGVSANASPVERYYYDIAGRLVSREDANGHRTRLSLIAGTGYDG
ncbi:hypothetical protein, partial [Sphingomonas sp. DT-204]|uniref:hypothetical protein n=1 Tax=Sphingomonas sp. DT-204 TaxID=3396166 RepID=UPI003F1BA406